MKRFFAWMLALVCLLALAGCKQNTDESIANEANITGIVKDIADNAILIENEDGEYWVYPDAENRVSAANLHIGDEVVVSFDGMVAESYPMQIHTVYGITVKTPAAVTDDAAANPWGVTLEAENVTPVGLTIVCRQSGGEDVAELNTGSDYTLQRLVGSEWVDVEYLPQEYEVAWTSEAWIIPKDATTRWDVNWEWLYGELPAGEYRIGKTITNFSGPGDYDSALIFAEFTIA